MPLTSYEKGMSERMIFKKHTILVSSAFVLIICAAAPIIAQLVPLNGALRGSYTITQIRASPPLYSGHSEAVGNVLHMGKTTLIVDGQSSIDSAGNIVPVPDTWNASLTAANGDKVFLVYFFPSNDNASGKYALSGKYTITGGTGRFAGASGEGSYTAEGTYLVFPGAVSGQYAGSLSGDISTKN